MTLPYGHDITSPSTSFRLYHHYSLTLVAKGVMIAAECQHQNTIILFFFFFCATLNPYVVFCFGLIFIGVQLIYNVGLVKIQSFLKVWEDGCEGGHGVWNPARGLQEVRPPGLATLAPAPILERSNNTCVLWLQKSFLFIRRFHLHPTPLALCYPQVRTVASTYCSSRLCAALLSHTVPLR